MGQERRANITRKKSLDNLPFIHLPYDHFLTDFTGLEHEEKLQQNLETLHTLEEQGIVNFMGKTNTDLKLEYGVANLDTLIAYDQNFEKLLVLLQEMGALLYEENDYENASKYLEYAISLHTDIYDTYALLLKIYDALNTPQKKNQLFTIADTLSGIQKKRILALLS